MSKRRETRERAAASGLLPHEFLLAVTRGETIDGHAPTFEERLEAARAAAPYFAPKLSNIQATVQRHGDVTRLTDEELEAIIREEAPDIISALNAHAAARAKGKPH